MQLGLIQKIVLVDAFEINANLLPIYVHLGTRFYLFFSLYWKSLLSIFIIYLMLLFYQLSFYEIVVVERLILRPPDDRLLVQRLVFSLELWLGFVFKQFALLFEDFPLFQNFLIFQSQFFFGVLIPSTFFLQFINFFFKRLSVDFQLLLYSYMVSNLGFVFLQNFF